MEPLLRRALELFVGRSVNVIECNGNAPNLTSGCPTIFSLRPSKNLLNSLRIQGYINVHSFATVPSRNMARWLLPTGNRCGMIAGTCMYEPHKWAARAVKSTLLTLMKVGWNGACCSKVVIASTGKLGLEKLVHDVTGEAQPVFAMSLGRQAAVRKLTVQVMRPSGEILGYIKLPLTATAVGRVRNEARMVERLWTFPTLRLHIPQLLYSGNWNGTYVVFQSRLEGDRGPLLFSGAHEAFLRTLWEIDCTEVAGEKVINTVATRWRRTSRYLDREWEEIGDEVLRRAACNLQGRTLRCGVMHGDFAPWNTRVHQNNLLLFDWESADWQAPNAWDKFHFQVRSSYYLNKHKRLQIPVGDASEESSFLLYGLSSVCQLLEEENSQGIDVYKKLLVRAFQRQQAWLGEPVSAV